MTSDTSLAAVDSYVGLSCHQSYGISVNFINPVLCFYSWLFYVQYGHTYSSGTFSRVQHYLHM